METITHHIFHSMGIPIHITLVGSTEVDAAKRVTNVERVFQSYDERFSRFKETSELHKLNTASSEWRSVSLPMFQVIKKCVLIAQETRGAFDPSVGTILASYGYGLPANFTPPSPTPTFHDIEFNDRELSVRLSPGQILEPASIVKGIAIDEAARELVGIPGYLINAGGDIITRGDYKNGTSWNIAIQDPQDPNAIVAAVTLRNKGMATSGTYQTRGSHKNEKWHHLIDMRTGKPTSNIVSATIIANTCEEADTEASLAILLPENEAVARLQSRGLPYFLIKQDSMVLKNAAFTALEVPVQTLLNQQNKSL